MKKYFVCADVHGFYNELIKALNENGFEEKNQDHILIICGDLFDRGHQANLVYKFIKSLAKKNRLIYIRGNHEDLLENLLNQAEAGWNINDCHFHNRTIDTFEELAGWNIPGKYLDTRKYFWNPECWTVTGNIEEDKKDIELRNKGLKKVKAIVNWINKHTVDYAEIGNYIFVHGWIPCEKWDKFNGKMSNDFEYIPDWRTAPSHDWSHARWVNGMLAAHNGVIEPAKTIVCGHWHCSFGHKHILKDCETEFGLEANFNIYKNTGIIALDTCTAITKRVNVLVLTEEEIYK